MNLKELVEEAKQASPDFKKKYEYWVTQRQKTPTLEWLMPKIESALGRDYVREQAQRYIDSQNNQEETRIKKVLKIK